MTTIVGWFPEVAPLRDAVLDLFTIGVPRPNVSIVMHSPQGDQAHSASAEAVEESGLPDFVAALPDAGPLTLADSGPMVGAGSIVAELAAHGGDLAAALSARGVGAEHAVLYADELRRGGALLIVESDEKWDTNVQGVFRHNSDPTLRAATEHGGPLTDDAAPNGEPDNSVSATVGAFTGGIMPAGWGETGVELETGIEDRQGDRDRRG